MSTPVFSVHGLIAWLETQDPETEYNWRKTGDCLGSRYLKARGVQDLGAGYRALSSVDVGNEIRGLGSLIFLERPWTYGAALARAKETV